MRLVFVLATVTALTACSTTIQEVPGTITLGLDTYPTVTRTFQREDGSTYARTTVRIGAERVTCRANDVADCRVAVSDIKVRDR